MENMVQEINELTKQQIRKSKIDKARLIRGSKQSVYVSEDTVTNTTVYQ